MFFVFFFLWIIFNGRVTAEIVLFGLAVAGVMYAFACHFMGYSVQKDKWLFRRSLRVLEYAGVLIWEIIKANMAVIRILVLPDSHPQPALIHFKTDLRSRTARVLLANSITLTPGTITVALDEDELVVHCLDRSMGEGIEESVFVHMLRRLEAEGQ